MFNGEERRRKLCKQKVRGRETQKRERERERRKEKKRELAREKKREKRNIRTPGDG